MTVSNRVPPLPPNAAMRWSVTSRLLATVQPGSILEIGCGQGAFGARLARQARYLAVEPDPTSYQVAEPRITAAGGKIRNASSEELAPDLVFDLVCAFEVLEHLADDRGALASWRRHVAPGGHLLISMPAWPERFNHWDAMVGHYRRYSPEQTRTVLRDAGLTPVEVVVYGWPLGYATENVRSRIAARRGRASEGGGSTSMAERTAGSGRVLQPRAMLGVAVQAATYPFTALQRLRPDLGTGVVALARRED